ncbi:S24/S26 family peptidase [Janibacter melonis]|uniref:S24/S26 family peptidase n=1 Tax=Janibacter melonis TaxID=262209 RepID=UPI001968340B|nr:S24/S26 family peptidase [Janibacter melonis]
MALPFALVRVTGASMEPTLRAGDLLLARRGASVRPGDVVLCDLPPDPWGRPRPTAVKRVTGTDPDDPGRWWVESDDPRAGVSSFDPTVGSLPPEAVHARVILRVRCRKWDLRVRRVGPAPARD